MKTCECGCGNQVNVGRRFVLGHSNFVLRRGRTYEQIYGKERAATVIANCSGHVSSKKGKTYEEFYGEEKASKINQKIITSRFDRFPTEERTKMASENAKIGASHIKGKTLEQFHGVEKGRKLRSGRRDAMIHRLENGTSYLGTKRGYAFGVRFDSSWEERLLLQLNKFDLAGQGFSIERCHYRIEYFYGKLRVYLPDYQLKQFGHVVAIIEVKCEQRLLTVEKELAPYKMRALKRFCQDMLITPCLYTEQHFPNANPEPSSVNELIQLTHKRFAEYVAEKVHRLESEDNQTNNLSVAQEVPNV
jgi:hypothetical protein